MYYKLLQLVPSLKIIIEDQGRSEELTNICAKVHKFTVNVCAYTNVFVPVQVTQLASSHVSLITVYLIQRQYFDSI